MKKSSFIKCFIIITFLFIYSNSLTANDNTFEWRVGEELTYKVKWAFIRLGTLKLQVCDSLVIDSTLVYHIKLYIDSNPLLFFVNMHNVYESYITNDFQLHHFYADEKIDGVTYKAEYRMDYTDSLIHIHKTDVYDTTRTIERLIPLDKTILDGTSLVFYARKNAYSNKVDTVTSFFEAEPGEVVINFKGKKEKIKISVMDSLIECYYIDGEINTKGIAGVTGAYKGWFSTDGQRPPLKAEMKVFVGKVKVELEEWKEWKPKD